MPYRVKIRVSPTATWQADVDAQGKVSSGAGFPPISLGNMASSLELINRAITFVESEGLISIEVEKL